LALQKRRRAKMAAVVAVAAVARVVGGARGLARKRRRHILVLL
jgi:hypothetical protein